jgi:hypothetical protein
LTNECCDAGTIIAQTSTGCPTNSHAPQMADLQLNAGTYYVTIEGVDMDEHGTYVLGVTGCRVDGALTAPGTTSGNTCGAGNDCDLMYFDSAEDQIFAVTIPDEDEWSFVAEGGFHFVELTSGCCTGLIDLLMPAVYCHRLTPGLYYVRIEGHDSTYCGPYTLTVERCRYRCCYGETFHNCTNTWEAACDALGGILDYGRDCETDPCPEIPLCASGAQYGQLPRAPDGWDANAWPSDLNSPTRYYDDFTGLADPINHVRFWGFDWTGDVSCDENPMPFSVEFRSAAGYTPGPVVATYTDTLLRQLGAVYSLGRVLYQYDMAIDPPLPLSDGWIGIAGAGNPDCEFYWMTSAQGSNHVQIWYNADSTWHGLGARDMAFCLGSCPQPDSLTLQALGGNLFTMSFFAPADATYHFYMATSRTAAWPADFAEFYSHAFSPGHHDLGLSAPPTYSQYVVTTDCGTLALTRSGTAESSMQVIPLR